MPNMAHPLLDVWIARPSAIDFDANSGLLSVVNVVTHEDALDAGLAECE